jgi:hypothetical protein
LKNKFNIFLLLTFFSCLFIKAQNNTFSPYSRYGLGELNPPTFAHNQGMGGAYIAYKPDSLMPNFINTGNPAAYALIKLTTLEVGGRYTYSNFTGNTNLKKWGANFSYGALGFPVRSKGGACFGIMPYTNVGYDLQNSAPAANIGDITYLYSGNGGLNKAFIGYGVMPFGERLVKFRKKNLYVPDSVKHLGVFNYRVRETINKVLSDFSLGFNANYIFGSIGQTARVVYPNSIVYNNSYRQQNIRLADFTGNFGIQTAITIDSVTNKNKKHAGKRRALKEKVKITFGAFMTLNNALKSTYDASGYNYILNGFGQEVFRDTIFSNSNQKTTVRLPLEQGVGIGFKKGERINIASDFAMTGWQNFKLLDNNNSYKNNYRIAIGVNYVPEKYAAGNGAFVKRINYRLGLNYNTGFIQLNNNTLVNSYGISAGVGLPVGIGRLSSMVNISAQYGKMGPVDNSSTKENYWKINFGFTFCDRWFQKFRYD